MTTPISRAEVTPYSLPFAAAYVTARGRIDRREMVLLRLSDDEGRSGLGEAVPLALRGGAALTEVAGALEGWARRVAEHGCLDWTTGEPPDEGAAGIVASLPAPARCAVLTAAADLEARRREIPLWRLLGAEGAEPITCNATLVSAAAESVAADAAGWATAGFSTFKLKVGLDRDPVSSPQRDRDLAQVTAVREAVGTQARIRVDANGAWGKERALQALRRMVEYGIELAEEPTSPPVAMTRLRGELGGLVPIAADESVDGPESARRALETGSCDLATVKLSKVGNIQACLDRKLPIYLSSALDGPVGIAAAAHAYQALPDEIRAALPGRSGGADVRPLAQGLATGRLFAETIAERECELRGDALHLPPGAGLAVEIDPAALERHRL